MSDNTLPPISRDEAIVREFSTGKTQEQVADEYNISHQRVSQIWRNAGLSRERVAKPRAYIGASVSLESKRILAAVSKQRGVTRSKLLDELILAVGSEAQ